MTNKKTAVASAIKEIFAKKLSNNLTAKGRRDHYGFRVDRVSDDLSEFDLTLTFFAGQSYCCIEWGCHVGMFYEDWWKWFRKELAENGFGQMPAMTIRRLRCVIQKGALITTTDSVQEHDQEYEVGPFYEDSRKHSQY